MVKIVEEKRAEEVKSHVPVDFSPKGKKPVWIFVLIAAVIIAGALFFVLFSGGNNNITTQTLKLKYSMQLDDGTIITNGTNDFTDGAVASTIGISSRTIDSLIENMSVGEEKEFNLSASEAFGEYDPEAVITINRTSELKRKSEINRTIAVQTELFKQVYSEDPVLDKTYPSNGAPWDYTVAEIDNSTGILKLRQDAIAGNVIPLSEILSMNITSVTADKITTQLEAQEQTLEVPTGNLTIKVTSDYIYFTLTPPVGEKIEIGSGTAKVLSYNETSIVLDYNIDYAGQNVILKLKLLEKKSSTSASAGYSTKSIAGAPTLDVFIMSYCPYGTQMEKALIPAWKLLRDKANINVRFVSYAMHGDKEEQENKRQLCLREETDKFWSYLECFLEAGDSAGCLNKAGVDSSKLNTCMSTKADSYWDVDKGLNTQYGVQGSPTVVLDEEVIQVARSPEALKEAVCNAFATEPSQCSQTLSSDSATAGFGYGTSSSASSSSAGCGTA